jgi:hypothetical protein
MPQKECRNPQEYKTVGKKISKTPETIRALIKVRISRSSNLKDVSLLSKTNNLFVTNAKNTAPAHAIALLIVISIASKPVKTM